MSGMTPRIVFLGLLLSAGLTASAQPYETLFNHSDPTVTYLRVASDGVRNTYAAGIKGGDLFVQKLDDGGQPVWSTSIPDTPSTRVFRILLDANQDIYVGSVHGTTDKFAMITSLRRTDGSVRWISNFDCGDKDDSISDIAVAKVGNSVLLYQLTNVRVSATNNDVMARRINPATGAEIWRRQIGGTPNDFPIQIVANSGGAPFIAATLNANRPSVIRLAGTDGAIVFNKTQSTFANFQGAARGIAVLSDGRIGFNFDGADNQGNANAGGEILEAANGALARGHNVPTRAAVGTRIWTGIAATKRGGFVSWFDTGEGEAVQEITRDNLRNPLFFAVDSGTTLAVDLGDQIQAASAGGSRTLHRFPSLAQQALPGPATEIDVDNKDQVVLAVNNAILKLRQRVLAANDAFARPVVNGKIDVPASGFLQNDGGVVGAAVELFQAPTKGTVVIQPNGSFSYTPGQTFVGADTFIYRLTKDGFSSNGTVTVRELKIGQHTLPSSDFGGDSVVGTLTFNAPPDPDLILEVSDNSSAVTSPAPEPIGPTSNTRSYILRTLPVNAQFNVAVTVKIQSITNTRNFSIKPGGLKELVALRTSFISGESTIGIVRLTGPRAATIQLSANDPIMTVPSSVSTGSNEVAFIIETAQSTTAKNVTLTAKLALVTKTLSFQIAAMPRAQAFTSFGHVVGGASFIASVDLDKVTPYDLVVTLTKSPSNAPITLPAQVTVDKNKAFEIFEAPTTAVTADRNVTISATAGGVTIAKTIRIIRNPLNSLVITPGTVIGGTAATGRVALDNLAPPDGISVSLATNGADVNVPPTVNVVSGAWAAEFPILTKPVTSTVTRTVFARVANVTKSATITMTR